MTLMLGDWLLAGWKLSDVIGVVGHALLWSLLAVHLAAASQRWPRRGAMRLALQLALAGGLLLTPLPLFSRGLFGDLSITLLLVLKQASLATAGYRGGPLAAGWRPWPRSATAIVAALGAVLYGGALGFLPDDLYRYGFAPQGLLLGWALALCLLWPAAPLLAMGGMLALFAFAGGLGTSVNLWDYGLDPLLWLWACYRLIRPLPRGTASAAPQ